MALRPAEDLGPYPETCTDASWKTAKTEKARDKWRTNVGAALRKAEAAYNKVDPEKLDLSLYEKKHPEQDWKVAEDFNKVVKTAREHNQAQGEAARKALTAAISSCKTTSLNPIISAQSRAKAKQIVKDLTPRLAQLKSFSITDYRRKGTHLQKQAKQAQMKRLMERAAQLKNQPSSDDNKLKIKKVSDK